MNQDENQIVAYKPTSIFYEQIIKQCIEAPGRVSDTNNFLKKVASRSKYVKKKIDKKNVINKWWNAYPCRCDTCKEAITNYSMNIA